MGKLGAFGTGIEEEELSLEVKALSFGICSC